MITIVLEGNKIMAQLPDGTLQNINGVIQPTQMEKNATELTVKVSMTQKGTTDIATA